MAGWVENGNLILGLPHIKAGPTPVPDGEGGMFLVWMDYRTRPPGPPDLFMDDYADLYALHVLADGTLAPGWPADGLALCTEPWAQGYEDAVGDGAGGFLVVWGDSRDRFSEFTDVYALRVRGDGTLAPGWTAGGVRVSNEFGYQLAPPRAAPDGLGGMFVTYTDLTECCYKLAVQHMTGAGEPAPGWPANGRRLVDNAGDQDHEVIIPDGAGGAIVAWTDARQAPGDPNIYAQRIEPDGPTPVLVSLVSVAAETDWVRLEWSAAGGTMLAADVERRSETSDWERLTTLTLDGTGRLRYEDRAVSPGARYAYRLSYTDGAAIVRTAETWVTVPVPRFALRGLTPNPSAGDPVIAFTLTSAEPASIELYDLAGRLVLAREVGSLGPGAQSVRLETRGHLAAGVYTVVLRQGTQLAKARAVLLR